MTINSTEARPVVALIRWSARLIVSLTLVLAWFIAIGYAVTDPSFDPVGVALVVGLIGLTLVAAMAWFRERAGGMTLIILGVVGGVFAYLASTPNNLGAGLISMLPWLISGVLFVLVDKLDPRQRQ
jgi:hypothetical protein